MKSNYVRLSQGVFLVLLLLCGNAFAQPMNGAYTINSMSGTTGMNFQSFTDFATRINTNGISGPVTVTVQAGSGPYQEQVVINTVNGASAVNTVTLEGNGETITAVTNSTDRHVLRLSNVSYFTVNNLHVNWDPSSTGGFYGIHIFGTGNFITISNCSVDLSGTTSTLYGAYVASGSETSILTTGDFHNISFLNNTAMGGGYGVSLFGLVNNLASNIIIDNNNLFDFSSNGIYLRETDGVVVSNNKLDKRTSNVTTVNAIQLAQAANINARIFNNYISVTQTANGTMTFRGIYLFNGTGHRVYNNVLYSVNLTSGNFTGIEIRTASTAPEIYFNTISIDNPLAGSGNYYGIKEELSNTNSILRNNLISISQNTSGTKSGLVLGTTSTVGTAFNSNYNLIWVPGGNVAQKGTISPTFYASLTDWKSASGQDLNSLGLDPMLTSFSNPVPTNVAADNAGISISGINTDVLGNLRGFTPDIGAYEFLSTGTSSLISQTGFELFPIPAIDFLNIRLKNEGLAFSDYEITDMNGRMVLTGSNLLTNDQTEKIFVGMLPKGNYIFRMKSTEGNINAIFSK